MAPLPSDVQGLCDAAAALLKSRLAGGRIYLYGSWARGDSVERSDLDFAVDASTPYDPATLGEAAASLDDLPTLREVSLLDLATVEPEFRSEVLRHARPL